jgi:hypothetical protein
VSPTLPPTDDHDETPDEALRALRGALDAGRPERRTRSLVDGAHSALDAALDAARVAGRTETLAEYRPSDLTRSEADRTDYAAVLAAELAHGAVHALVRGVR